MPTPRPVDSFSGELGIMDINANDGLQARSILNDIVSEYNLIVNTYNNAHPTLPQIPTVEEPTNITSQIADMIVAAQVQAGLSEMTVGTLTDLYNMIESQITNLVS